MGLAGRLFGGIDRKVADQRNRKKVAKRRKKSALTTAKARRAEEKKKDAAMRAEARKSREAYFKKWNR